MLSFGTEKLLAFSTADASVMLPSTLPPPSRAATSTARRSFAYMFDRFASVASFLRLIVAHFEWPDIPLHLTHEVVVEPGLTHELWVEGCHNEVVLLQDDGPVLEGSEHLDCIAHALDPGRADEHAAHPMLDPADVEVGFERVHLAAVGVAANGDVHQREERVAAVDLACEDDHAGARAEDRHAGTRPLTDRLDQPVGASELADRRRLAAGERETVDLGDLLGRAHLDRGRAELGERCDVLPEVALEG